MSTRGSNHNNCFICFKSPFKNPGISLHRFPTCQKLRLVWLEACNLTESDYLSSRRLCSNHFDVKCFNTNYIRKSLKSGSVPTIFTNEELEHRLPVKESEDQSKISIDRSRLMRESKDQNGISIERSRFIRESEDQNRISIERSGLKRESEDQNKKSIKRSRLQTESKNESTIPVMCIELSSTEEESSNEKESSHEEELSNEEESSNEEEIQFCPTSMIRYDNPFNPFSTQWVCRICLSVMLSENAVHNHLKISCENTNIVDFGPNMNHDDDNIENNGDDEDNKEDDDKSITEDCGESNKNNDCSGDGNKEEDDDDDDVDVDNDSDDDYHEDDEDEDDDDDDDEINDPCELIDLVNTV